MMNIDKILEVISKTENWDDLIRIGEAFNNRFKHLTQLAMQRLKQKYKMGDRIKVKTTDGEYHPAMIYGFTKNKVRIILYNKEVKVSPVDLEKWSEIGGRNRNV